MNPAQQSTPLYQDIVAIYDGFSQVFRDARPMRASVRKEARLMEHPLEDGRTVIDHMTVQPAEIDLAMTLVPETGRETYSQIMHSFIRGKILTVHTKAGSYRNMVIQSLPHDETPEMLDAFTMQLHLKEVLFVRDEFSAFNPKNPSQAATVDRGEVQPIAIEGNPWGSRRIKW